MAIARPNLFLVGAPKCGTTALYTYLGRHPDIFMSPRKELHFFGRDLDYGKARISESKYLSFFAAAGACRWRGEASVFSLFSRTAAAEIAAFSPDARIVIMLRDPVEMLHALHGENLSIEREDIPDFAQALAAEPARRAGQRIPPYCTFVRGLYYSEIARYTAQVQRYIDAFGRDRVHIILFEDFKTDPEAAFRGVLDFLQVDSTIQSGFEVVNASHALRSRRLRRLYADPPDWLKLPLRILPLRARSRIARGIRQLNARPSVRAPLAPELARRFRTEFKDEALQLGKLLGRDLRHWSDATDA